MKLALYSILVAATLCSTQGCTQEPIAQGPFAHDEALLMARQAATKHGYDLKEYSLLSNPNNNDLMPGGKEWFFLYTCKVPAPGCAFSVTVNRVSGATEIQPGE